MSARILLAWVQLRQLLNLTEAFKFSQISSLLIVLRALATDVRVGILPVLLPQLKSGK